MPLRKLRFVNPGGTRRKRSRAAKPKSKTKARRKRVAKPSKATLRRRAKSAPRYKSGPKKGQFKPRGAVKKRRRKTAKKKTTTRRRRKRVAAVAAPRKRRRTTKRKRTTTKRKSPKRVAAGKKAARTRKRRASAKRASATTTTRRRRRKTTRRKPVARKRKKSTRRRKHLTAAHKAKISRALRGKRRRKSNPGRKSNPKRRRRRGRLSRRSVMLAPAPRRKAKRYRVRRTHRRSKGGTGYYQYSLSRQNPGGALKGPLMAGLGIFGGVLASRMMGALLAKHVLPKILPSTTSASTARWVGAVAPGLSMFLLATFLGPKIIKGKPNVLRGLQMGSVVALADGVVNALAVSGVLPASISPYLLGPGVAMSGFGAFNYTTPLSEYVDMDNRLGEYVDYDNRLAGYGGEATEPLALGADELAYFQTGGAGGVFNKTVFHGVG